jgi:hypothetical protein
VLGAAGEAATVPPEQRGVWGGPECGHAIAIKQHGHTRVRHALNTHAHDVTRIHARMHTQCVPLLCCLVAMTNWPPLALPFQQAHGDLLMLSWRMAANSTDQRVVLVHPYADVLFSENQ